MPPLCREFHAPPVILMPCARRASPRHFLYRSGLDGAFSSWPRQWNSSLADSRSLCSTLFSTSNIVFDVTERSHELRSNEAPPRISYWSINSCLSVVPLSRAIYIRRTLSIAAHTSLWLPPSIDFRVMTSAISISSLLRWWENIIGRPGSSPISRMMSIPYFIIMQDYSIWNDFYRLEIIILLR